MHPDHVSRFVREYASTNYTFEDDPEAEHVARLLWRHARGRRVLDLGCGPTHHLLSLFFPERSESVGLELLPENLAHVRSAVGRSVPEASALRAARFLFRTLRHEEVPTDAAEWVRQRYRGIGDLLVGDVRARVPAWEGTFDTVIQVGCFLALDTVDEFRHALGHAVTYLAPGRVFLGINWLQRTYAPRPYRFNGRLSALLDARSYRKLLWRSDLRLRESGEIRELSPESRSLGYTSMVWAVLEKVRTW